MHTPGQQLSGISPSGSDSSLPLLSEGHIASCRREITVQLLRLLPAAEAQRRSVFHSSARLRRFLTQLVHATLLRSDFMAKCCSGEVYWHVHRRAKEEQRGSGRAGTGECSDDVAAEAPLVTLDEMSTEVRESYMFTAALRSRLAALIMGTGSAALDLPGSDGGSGGCAVEILCMPHVMSTLFGDIFAPTSSHSRVGSSGGDGSSKGKGKGGSAEEPVRLTSAEEAVVSLLLHALKAQVLWWWRLMGQRVGAVAAGADTFLAVRFSTEDSADATARAQVEVAFDAELDRSRVALTVALLLHRHSNTTAATATALLSNAQASESMESPPSSSRWFGFVDSESAAASHRTGPGGGGGGGLTLLLSLLPIVQRFLPVALAAGTHDLLCCSSVDGCLNIASVGAATGSGAASLCSDIRNAIEGVTRAVASSLTGAIEDGRGSSTEMLLLQCIAPVALDYFAWVRTHAHELLKACQLQALIESSCCGTGSFRPVQALPPPLSPQPQPVPSVSDGVGDGDLEVDLRRGLRLAEESVTGVVGSLLEGLTDDDDGVPEGDSGRSSSVAGVAAAGSGRRPGPGPGPGPGVVRAWLKGEEYASYAHLLAVYRARYSEYLTHMPLPPPLINYYLDADWAGDNSSSSSSSSSRGRGRERSVLGQISLDVGREDAVLLLVKGERASGARGEGMEGKTNVSGGRRRGVRVRHVGSASCPRGGTGTGTGTDNGSSSGHPGPIGSPLSEEFFPVEDAGGGGGGGGGTDIGMVGRLQSLLSAAIQSVLQGLTPAANTSPAPDGLMRLLTSYTLLGLSRTYTIGDGFFVLQDLFGAADGSCVFTPAAASRSAPDLGNGPADDPPLVIIVSRRGVKVRIRELFDLLPVEVQTAGSSGGSRPAALARFLVEVETLLLFQPPGAVAAPPSTAAAPESVKPGEEVDLQGLLRMLRCSPEKLYHRSLTIQPLPLPLP